MKESQMARALHINLGDQTAKKLDELSLVLEENKTALVSRLIREEWERERTKVAPIVQTGPFPDSVYVGGNVDPAEVSRELAFQVARGAESGRR
jgi:hypothetical protein